MKVLQVVPAYYPAIVYGGPIFSIHFACQALARRGVEIFVATTNANGRSRLDVPADRSVQFEPNYSVRYYNDTVNSRFSWAVARNLATEVKRADLIHLQDVYWIHAVQSLVLAAVYGKPVLISPRGIFSAWALAARKRLVKRVFLSLFIRPLTRNTIRVAWHATSAAERDEFRSVMPGCTVHVVPNGLDCAVFAGPAQMSRETYLARFFPARSTKTDRPIVLIALGRLHKKKNFDVAIGALNRVRDRFATAILLIAGGDDGERADLETMIARDGLSDRVALVGEIAGDDKVEFLKGADLFLFPSHSENFGMVALEALAAGVPVIASRNTPWAEVEAEGCGVWVENSVDAFADALRQFLPLDLSVLRDKARGLARRYDYSVIAGALQTVYSDLIHDNQR